MDKFVEARKKVFYESEGTIGIRRKLKNKKINILELNESVSILH